MPTALNNRHIFAIGDIHGQADRLDALLGRLLGLEPAARFVFLGDYIDRGGQSRQVVDRLLALKTERPDTVLLMGNHEATLLRYDATRSAEDLRQMRATGYQATLDSYAAAGLAGLEAMPQAHRLFFLGLERWFRADPYVFFHAPLPAGVDPDQADALELERLLANRKPDTEGWRAKGLTQVFGHVPMETPLAAPGLIGVDTNAGRGRVLTALELPAVRFHHA